MVSGLNLRKNQLNYLERQLSLLSPTNVLARGYAIVKNKQGNVIYRSADVIHHERVEVILHQGSISAIIDKRHKTEQDELI